MFVRTSRVAVVESLEKRTHLSVATFGNGNTSGGTYNMMEFMEESSSYYMSNFGYVTVNGSNGLLAGAYTQGASTDGLPHNDSWSSAFSLGADGLFTSGEMGGYVATPGDTFVLSPIFSTDPYTSLAIGTRRGTGMSTASVNGNTYNLGMWLGNGTKFVTGKGSATLNSGTVNYNITNVWQGQAIASDRLGAGTGTDTYSISSNGTLTLSDGWVGGVRPDGQMLFFGDGDGAAVGDTGIAVGVKQGSGMTNASIKGRYQGILIASGLVGGVKKFSSGAAWFDLNGTGGMSGSVWETQQGQSSGSWITNNSFTGTYSVSSTGALTLNAGETLSGYVSADGSVVVIPMVAESTNKENGLMVLVRAPIAGKVGNVLQVNGTSFNDVLTVSPNSTNLVVSAGYRSQTFAASGITQINADAGVGNDRITLSANIASLLKGGLGNDTIVGFGGADTLYGNDGNDILYGNSGNDSILAGLGNDNIDAGSGDDDLYGGDGTDTIRGGLGHDYIEGKGKSDTIYGDDGNDTIYGGAGADLIYGNAGNDYIDVGVATVFHDTVDAGAGTDTVVADGDDIVSGAEVLA